jgi:hypothetical protein
MSPDSRSSWLVSNRGGFPSRFTATLPVTALTAPAFAEIPKRSRFCAGTTVTHATKAAKATNVLSTVNEVFIVASFRN